MKNLEKKDFVNTKETTNKDLVSSIWLISEQQRLSFILTILKKWSCNIAICRPMTDIAELKGQMCKTSILIWLSISHLFSPKPSQWHTSRCGILKCYAVQPATCPWLTEDPLVPTHHVFPCQYCYSSLQNCTSVIKGEPV